MWIITKFGFFSVVKKNKSDKFLTIRSRVKEDLELLKERYLPNMTDIQENKGTDYQYRATAEPADVANAIADAIEDINYSNFKNAVMEFAGHKRASIYAAVWNDLWDLDDKTDYYPTTATTVEPPVIPFNDDIGTSSKDDDKYSNTNFLNTNNYYKLGFHDGETGKSDISTAVNFPITEVENYRRGYNDAKDIENNRSQEKEKESKDGFWLEGKWHSISAS